MPATVAPRIATVVPSTSVRAGRNASAASRPRPTTASGGSASAAAAMARKVPPSGARPKSRAWLFAIVATSMPAEASAAKARGGAWNTYRLPGAGCPPLPTEVSRFTIATSAAARAPVTGASAVAGSSNLLSSAPSKCTSPATAIVSARGPEGELGLGAGGGAAGDVGTALLDGVPDGSAGSCRSEQAAVIASTASATGTAPRRNDVMR